MSLNLTLPKLDSTNTFFWTSGADGVLRLLRCQHCEHWVHPPRPMCPSCLGEALSPAPVSGLGTVEAVTVNHQPWAAGMEVPFAIAIVGLDEQPSLRLTTNVIGVAPEEVRIGQRVRVRFSQCEDVWLPLFEPIQ